MFLCSSVSHARTECRRRTKCKSLILLIDTERRACSGGHGCGWPHAKPNPSKLQTVASSTQRDCASLFFTPTAEFQAGTNQPNRCWDIRRNKLWGATSPGSFLWTSGARAAYCGREWFSSVGRRMAAERPFTIPGVGRDPGDAPSLWHVKTLPR